jgi:hypothetical protein
MAKPLLFFISRVLGGIANAARLAARLPDLPCGGTGGRDPGFFDAGGILEGSRFIKRRTRLLALERFLYALDLHVRLFYYYIVPMPSGWRRGFKRSLGI